MDSTQMTVIVWYGFQSWKGKGVWYGFLSWKGKGVTVGEGEFKGEGECDQMK